MATIRVVKDKSRPWVQIHKAVLQDQSISWKAKGVMAYLLSLPDDWRIYVRELITHSTDGRDATQSALRELVDAGYVYRVKARARSGRFIRDYYWVFEEKQSDPIKYLFSSYGLSWTGKPVSGDPDGMATLIDLETERAIREKHKQIQQEMLDRDLEKQGRKRE